ncbi:MAG TPA: large conductance mechanosensitive channel protein MscL [Actinomycetota bacterium]|nr:large conductance mechanosensitive channel protein MscL [Actinomycetota bacterium]
MFKEFRAFVLRGNVVDLAIGVVIGAAFGAIVTAIVSGLINPLVSFVGTGDLSKAKFCIGKCTGVPHPHVFNYGGIISAMITFVIVAAVVFFFVVKPVNHLMDMFKSDQPAEKPMRECPFCESSIPVGAKRCAFCTSEVPALAG